MSRLSDFVNDSLLAAVHHVRQSAASSIPGAAHAILAESPLSYFSALASSSFLPISSQLYLTSPVLVVNSFEVLCGFRSIRVSHSIGFYRAFFGVLPPFRQFFVVPFPRLCSGTHLV